MALFQNKLGLFLFYFKFAHFWFDGSSIWGIKFWNHVFFFLLFLIDLSFFLSSYSPGSGSFSQLGSTPQISLPYSAMVRSELNLPLEATFMIAILAHKSWFCEEMVLSFSCDYENVQNAIREKNVLWLFLEKNSFKNNLGKNFTLWSSLMRSFTHLINFINCQSSDLLRQTTIPW